MVKAIKIIEEALKNKETFNIFCRELYCKGNRDRIKEDNIRAILNPKVRKRDNHKCCFCKRDVLDVNPSNTIHHKKPVRYGGEHVETNLITICNECHNLLEKLIKIVEKEAINQTLLYLRKKQTKNGKNKII